MTQSAPAPQLTKAHWDEAYKLFLQRLGDSKKLQKPVAVFQYLANLASQVTTFEPDPAKIAEVIHVQLLAHLLDRNSVGMQRQLENRPLQPSDLVIQWVPGYEPKAVSKWFPKAKASWIDEVAEREKEAEQHQAYLKARKDQEDYRQRCPGVIASFRPVRNGRVQFAAIEQVTSVLQKYLDGYEAQHQADLAKLEADKTFQAWSVNWMDVFAKMCTYVEKAYTKAEGRTLESERL